MPFRALMPLFRPRTCKQSGMPLRPYSGNFPFSLL